MKLFGKNNPNKQEKVINDIVWDRYINARSMEDQTLAKKMAEEYGIDYECFPVLDRDVVDKIKSEAANLKYYQRKREIREVVINVLDEYGLISH